MKLIMQAIKSLLRKVELLVSSTALELRQDMADMNYYVDLKILGFSVETVLTTKTPTIFNVSNVWHRFDEIKLAIAKGAVVRLRILDDEGSMLVLPLVSDTKEEIVFLTTMLMDRTDGKFAKQIKVTLTPEHTSNDTDVFEIS